VQLRFQEKPWDLGAAVGYTLLMTGGLLAFGEGTILAILLVFFVPGYVVVATLFPKNTQIDWVERVALSFGTSIAIVPLLGLLLNFTPWGIQFASILTTILVFTIGICCAAYWRRMREPPERRLAASISLGLPEWGEYSALDKVLTIALVVSVIVTGGTVVYFVVLPQAGEGFTEFYILGPGGDASGYPTRVNVSEPGSVIVVVVNHESSTVNYTVRVDLIAVNVVFNSSCSCNQTQEANRTSLAWLNQTLRDKENWTQRYTFRISDAGLWKLEFFLYKGAILTAQRLYLPVRVL
jgi:uncharacterized membrane protein